MKTIYAYRHGPNSYDFTFSDDRTCNSDVPWCYVEYIAREQGYGLIILDQTHYRRDGEKPYRRIHIYTDRMRQDR